MGVRALTCLLERCYLYFFLNDCVWSFFRNIYVDCWLYLFTMQICFTQYQPFLLCKHSRGMRETWIWPFVSHLVLKARMVYCAEMVTLYTYRSASLSPLRLPSFWYQIRDKSVKLKFCEWGAHDEPRGPQSLVYWFEFESVIDIALCNTVQNVPWDTLKKTTWSPVNLTHLVNYGLKVKTRSTHHWTWFRLPMLLNRTRISQLLWVILTIKFTLYPNE
jgi:hypothetical protein